MKTLQKIERKGYKVTFAESGRTIFAEKSGRVYKAENITQLFKLITGRP